MSRDEAAAREIVPVRGDDCPNCEPRWRQRERISSALAAARREGAESVLGSYEAKQRLFGALIDVADYTALDGELEEILRAMRPPEPSPCAHEMTSEGGYPHCRHCGGT